MPIRDYLEEKEIKILLLILTFKFTTNRKIIKNAPLKVNLNFICETNAKSQI